MFNLFKKNKKIDKNKIDNSNKFINQKIKFQDLTLQQIEIETKDIASDIILILKEKKSGTEIALDNELCKILSVILNEFSETKNLNNIIKTIGNEE